MPFFILGEPPTDAPTYEFPSPAPSTIDESFANSPERRHGNNSGGRNGSGAGAGFPISPTRPVGDTQQYRYPRVVWGGTVPGVTLKLRKRVYPLGITRLTAGVDVDVRTGGVAFKWAWTDRLLGARLSLDRHAVALTKRVPVPEVKADVEVKAALNLTSRKTLLSFAVRPQQGVVGMNSNGIALRQRLPIDKRVDVEMFGRVQLPNATIGTDQNNVLSLGEGDFVVHLDHVNLRLLLQ